MHLHLDKENYIKPSRIITYIACVCVCVPTRIKWSPVPYNVQFIRINLILLHSLLIFSHRNSNNEYNELRNMKEMQ